MRYFKSKCTPVYAGVDWLTATASTPESERGLWELGERLIQRAKLEGENPLRWHGNGYSGWSCEGMAVGSRAQGSLLRLSGQQASYEWRHAIATSDNASRLDLAVDVDFEQPMTVVARELYRDVGQVPSRNGRPPTRTLVQCSDGGQTCYVGKRVSDQMGRCYDKGVESGTAPAGRKWRWEVEYKGDWAWTLANGLKSIEEENRTIAGTVAAWFAARGGRIWPQVPFIALCKWEPRTPSSDRKLHWLASCVRPTAVALCDELGHLRVTTALGLAQNKGSP
jgi:hypothetical protein